MRRTLVIGTVAAAAVFGSAAVSIWLLWPRETSAATLGSVVSHAQAAQEDIFQGLGPNSTFHSIADFTDVASDGSQRSSRGEMWVSFDQSGVVISYDVLVTVPATGEVKKHEFLQNSLKVTVDGTGKIQGSPAPFGLTADGLRSSYLDGLAQLARIVNASAPAPTTTWRGKEAYVIETNTSDGGHETMLIDVVTFFPLLVESKDSSGQTFATSEQTTLEVLPALVTPTVLAVLTPSTSTPTAVSMSPTALSSAPADTPTPLAATSQATLPSVAP